MPIWITTRGYYRAAAAHHPDPPYPRARLRATRPHPPPAPTPRHPTPPTARADSAPPDPTHRPCSGGRAYRRKWSDSHARSDAPTIVPSVTETPNERQIEVWLTDMDCVPVREAVLIAGAAEFDEL